MSAVKVGVVGAAGKMGQELSVVIAEMGLVPFFGLYNKTKPEGYSHESNDWKNTHAFEVDLWIDFSLPENFDSTLKNLAKFKKPIVCGTTGLSVSQMELLKTTAMTLPLLWSSNMSVGIAFLNLLLTQFSSIKNFDFQIEELHHREKKDSPSGTAKTLKENLESSVGKKIPLPLSIRGGGIFGVHSQQSIPRHQLSTLE